MNFDNIGLNWMMLIFIDLTQAAQPGRDLQTAPLPHHTGGATRVEWAQFSWELLFFCFFSSFWWPP